MIETLKFLAAPIFFLTRVAFCLAIFCWGENGFGAVQLKQPVTFATANSVRIQVALESDEALGEVEISGQLMHARTGELLWRGSLGKVALQPGVPSSLTQTLTHLEPRLWDPASPNLYNLKISAISTGGVVATNSVRFGFRSFENRGGQFYLNDRPIFLRGLAINPPGRTIPPETGESRAFAESYVRYMKSKHFNAIRLTKESQVWFDVCDELGMMLFQGQYASPLDAEPMKKAAPLDFDRSMASYKKLFSTFASHPSIVIYILSNELPTSGTRGKAFSQFLTHACEVLKQWDSTRLYIGNAGYGEGREGDICDVHRYWGWYYNTFLTFYNLRNEKLFGDPSKVATQPLTFSECVGNFTGPNGEYNIIIRKQLGAQLNWTGHSADQLTDTIHYQRQEIREVTESFRRLRSINPHIAGVMPFTIAYANWSGIQSFDQMKPTPAMEQFGISYQPVLLSWEMWTPQVYAGTSIRVIAHVVNDADDGSALTNGVLIYELRSRAGKIIQRSQTNLSAIAYYGNLDRPLTISLPANLSTGDYILAGKIISGGEEISHNEAELFVAGKNWMQPDKKAAEVFLFDPVGRTATALKKIKMPFTLLKDIAQLPSTASALVIGEEAWTKQSVASGERLKQFINNGGRVLCLRQKGENFDQAWLPEPITFFTTSVNDSKYPVAGRPFSDNMNINIERPDHPVFAGLDRHRLALWSDYTGWDETKPGFPKVYPVTDGFKLNSIEALSHTAVLANYDRGLEGVALCEIFSGKGSVIVSAFDLVNRSGLDPAADRLLKNLVQFAQAKTGHDIHPLIKRPIQWGNYASERGLVTGPLNGLLINADWVKPPTNPSAKPLTQEQGEWNTRPSDQFVPLGRNPFGPYSYSTSSSLHGLNSGEKTGTGIFWARIPGTAKTMVTTVKNPMDTEAMLDIAVNEKKTADTTRIAPGQEVKIQSPLLHEGDDISVRYTGDRALVILETQFE